MATNIKNYPDAMVLLWEFLEAEGIPLTPGDLMMRRRALGMDRAEIGDHLYALVELGMLRKLKADSDEPDDQPYFYTPLAEGSADLFHQNLDLGDGERLWRRHVRSEREVTPSAAAIGLWLWSAERLRRWRAARATE